ncbi:hypothetical protein PENSPDRAFT_681128 [Peniophora sp. CONT]|nr:hypothetical protein PENSPDRAFT_681128 [Peniophora sp. CONT]
MSEMVDFPPKTIEISLWQDSTPVDILHEIFDWLSYFAPSEPRSRAVFPTWLHPIHVCKSWRASAMSYSPLWRYLPLENYGMTKMALHLSRPRTVIIDLRPDLLDSVDNCEDMATDDLVSRTFPPAALQLAFRSLRRAEYLSMPSYSGSLRSIRDVMVEPFKFPKRLLHLELWGWCIDTDWDSYSLIGKMFHSRTVPRLRSLRLVAGDVPVYIPVPLLNRMTSLTCLELSHERPVWMSLLQLFATLRYMTELEELVLGGSTFPRRGTIDPGRAEENNLVHLPHLKRLSLAGNEVAACRFLEHVDMPVCQYLSFLLDDDTELQTLRDAQLDVHEFEAAELWVNWGVDIPPLAKALEDAFGSRHTDGQPAIYQLTLISDSEDSAPSWVSDLYQFRTTLSSFPLLGRLNLTFLPETVLGNGLWQSVETPAPLTLPHLTHLSLEGPVELLLAWNSMIDSPSCSYKAFSVCLPHGGRIPDILEDTSGSATSFETVIRELISVPVGAQVSSSYTDLYVVAGSLEEYPRIVATKPVHLENGKSNTSLPHIIDLTLFRFSSTEDETRESERLGMVRVALARALKVIPLSAVDSVHLAHPMAGDEDVFYDALALPVQTARRLVLRYRSGPAPLALTEVMRFSQPGRLEEILLSDLAEEELVEKLVMLSASAAVPSDRVNRRPLTVRIERCKHGARMRDVLSNNPAIEVRWDRSDECLLVEGWRITERPWVAPFDRRTMFWRDEDVWVP